MKKFVSIFMTLVMVFTVVPNMFSRAERACEGDVCTENNNAEKQESLIVEDETGKTTIDVGTIKRCFGYSINWICNSTKARGTEVTEFYNDLHTFYKDNVKSKSVWPFWTLITLAGMNPVLMLRLAYMRFLRR